MIRFKILFSLLLALITAQAGAFVPSDGMVNQAVSVPYYDQDPEYLSNLSPVDPANPAWREFIRDHGTWEANINGLSGMIHRAYGQGIFVGIPTGEESARSLALSFLSSVRDLLGFSPDDLAFLGASHHGHHWFVEFTQQYGGLEVYGTQIQVRISDRGNVVSFQSDYLPGIAIPTYPALSRESAVMAASAGLFDVISLASPETKLLIFPLPTDNAFDYRLAYEVEIPTSDPARWMTVVDANTGEILYRKNLIYSYTADGYFNGRVYPFTPFDTLITRPFEFQTVNIDNVNPVQTDRAGLFTATVPDVSSRSIIAALRGDFVQVLNSAGAEASYSGTVTPGDTLRVLWDNTISLSPERNGFYHTNVVHDYIKMIDPDFTGLDFPLPCNINVVGTCNAFWDGSSINFYQSGGGCSNTAEIADVIYHEYGHGITDYMYRPGTPASGAQHEGWSDYTAATITNQPLIGRGFYSGNPDQYLRTVDNNNRYPEDWQGESHHDGLIVSGALWDMRQALEPRTGYCDSLWHFARYGHSGNFQDYALDILLYDDDDDNIFNHTPNWDLIMTALVAHGIAPLDRITFIHDPLMDTFDSSNPYLVAMWVQATLTAPNPDSVFVYYRTTGSGPYIQVHMTQDPDPTLFRAPIPAQPAGTLVEYYISVTDLAGTVYTSPPTAPLPTYFFVVGQLQVQFADSLERASGWTVGDPNDNADAGIWERVDPVGTWADSLPDYPYQPEDDFTADPGAFCFITGQHPAGNPNNGANDVDHGRTSVLTPMYNISGYTNPVVEYYRWFTTSRNVEDTFYVEISSDNVTWHPLEILIIIENGWTRARHLVKQILPDATQFRLRFAAVDGGGGSIVEGGVDDLTLYSASTTSINDGPGAVIPRAFALRDNYPNPFNGRTEISFDLPKPGDVALGIYDISGRLVYERSITGLAPGTHRIIWDGRDTKGASLSSGVYFYRLRAGENAANRKMLYLK